MNETTQPAAKTEPIPPPTGWAAVWKHMQNWTEIYLWVPMALLSIYVFAEFAYVLTGRRPTENADWIVGMGGNLVKLVFLIVFVSIERQQTGVWLTKDEQLDSPALAMTQALSKCVTLIVGAYILSH